MNTQEYNTPKLIDHCWQVGFINSDGHQYINEKIYFNKKEAVQDAIRNARIFTTWKYFIVKIERKKFAEINLKQ